MPPDPTAPKPGSPGLAAFRQQAQPAAPGLRESQGNYREPKAAGMPLADAFGVELAAFDKTLRAALRNSRPRSAADVSTLHTADAGNNALASAVVETPVRERPVPESLSTVYLARDQRQTVRRLHRERSSPLWPSPPTPAFCWKSGGGCRPFRGADGQRSAGCGAACPAVAGVHTY